MVSTSHQQSSSGVAQAVTEVEIGCSRSTNNGSLPSAITKEKGETENPIKESSVKETQRESLKEGEDEPGSASDRWTSVLCSFFIWLNTLGLIAAYGEFQAFYQAIYLPHDSPSSIAWIGSTQGAVFLLASIFIGPLFDRGYLRPLLVIGTFLATFGLMMASLAKNLWELVLAQGFCVGLGMSCLWIPAIGVVAQWWAPAKRGTANGIASLGGGIGGIIYPVIFRAVQLHAGFPWAIRACGFIVLGTQMVPIILMRTRVRTQNIRVLLDTESLKESTFQLCLLAAFFAYTAVYIPAFYVAPWSVQHNYITGNLSFYILAIFNTTATVGRLVMSVLADQVTGIVNMLVLLCIILGTLCFCWIAVQGSGGAIIFTLVLGWFVGAVLSLFPMLPVLLTSDMRRVGGRIGMAMGACSMGVLMGSPVAGVLVHDTTDYTNLFVFTGCLFFASSLMIFSIKLVKTGLKLVKF